MPQGRRQLSRHRQLRTARRGTLRILVAVGLPPALRRGRPDGHSWLRLRPGRERRLHSIRRQASLRRDPLSRHRRLQRRQPPQGFRHELQSRNQHTRDHAERPLLRGRQVDRDRPARHPPAPHLPEHWPARVVPAAPRGTRVARHQLPHHPARTLLDDLRAAVSHLSRRNPEPRHEPHRRNRIRGAAGRRHRQRKGEDCAATVPQGSAAQPAGPR